MRIPFSILCARLSLISALAVVTTLSGCGDAEEAAPAADTGNSGTAPAGGQMADSGGGEDYEGGDYEEEGGDGGGGGGGEHGDGGRMANNNAAMAPPGMGGGGMVDNNAAMAPPGMGGGGMVDNNASMAPPPGMGGGRGSGSGEHGDDEGEAGMMAFGGGGGGYDDGENEGFGGNGFGPPGMGGGGGFAPPAAAPTKDYAMWTRNDFVDAVRKRDRHVIGAIETQSESRIGDPEFAGTLTDVLGEMAGGSSLDALQGKPGFPAGMEPGGALRNNGPLVPPGGASLEQAVPMIRESFHRPLDSYEAMFGEAVLGYVPQASQRIRQSAGQLQQGGAGAPAPGGMSLPGQSGGGGGRGSSEHGDGGGAAGMMGQFGGGVGGDLEEDDEDAAGMMQQFGGGGGRGQGGGFGGPPGGGPGQGATGGGIQQGLTPTELVQSVVRALVRNNTDAAWKTLMRIVKGSQPTTLSSDENIRIVVTDTFSATTINAEKADQILAASVNQAMAGPSGHPTTLAMLGSISSRALDHYLGMQEAPTAPTGGTGGSSFAGQGFGGPPASGPPSFGGQNNGGSGIPGGRGPAGFNGTAGGGGSSGPPSGRGPAGPSGFNGTAGGGGSSGPPSGRGPAGPAGFNGTAGGGGGPAGFNGTAGGGGGIPGRPGAASPGGFGGGGEDEYEDGGFGGGFGGGAGFGVGQTAPPSFGPPTPTVNLTRDGVQPAAMALWSPEVTQKIAENVLNNSSPEMLQMASTIPAANVRRALFESFKNGYDAGADEFVGSLDLNIVDPGLLGVLKGLPRVRPSRSGAAPSGEQATKEAWVQATRSVVLSLRDRLRTAAGNPNLSYSGTSKVRLHRGAEVEQSIMMAVPNEATAELGSSAPAKMNIYYVRTSVTPQTASQRETLAKHYEKSAKGFRRIYAQEGMLWFDGVTRNSDGTRQTMDVIIQADGAAPSNNGGFPGGGGGFPGAAGSFPGSGGGEDYEGSSGPPGVGGALGPGSRQQGGAAQGSTFTIEVIVTVTRDPQDPISDDASLTSAGLDPERQ